MSLVTRPCKSVSLWCCRKSTVYFDVCTNPQADENGNLLVNVYADSIIGTFGSTPVVIDTDVDVYITVDGNLTNDISGLITVYSGNSYAASFYSDFVAFETIVSVTIDIISPSGSSRQIYLPGLTTFSGSCSLPPTPTPTNTPTISQTPTYTPTLTVTPTTLCCYQYEVTNYYTTSKIVYYTDCDGTPSSVSCAGNGLQTYINCALEGSLFTNDTVCDNSSTDCITWNAANTPCGGCVTSTPTPTETPTNTQTPTQTPTNTPTPTVTPSSVVSYSFCLGYDSTDCGLACDDYANCNNQN